MDDAPLHRSGQAMASDMVTALPKTTREGLMLFGHNCNRPAGVPQEVVRTVGSAFTPGETLRTASLRLPQVKQTATVLGGRSVGQWGYHHGVNEHGVAVGFTTSRSRLIPDAPGLTGAELVRLALERAPSAHQAVDLLTDLVGRHGCSSEPDAPADPPTGVGLMIADSTEAFVLAVSGRHWGLQQVGGVRALGEVCHIHKDWDRISHGLADDVIERGWWECDGSKVDFADALFLRGPTTAASLRRWGQCTMSLEARSGQIDAPFLRQLLGEHGLGRPEDADPAPTTTAASLIVQAWRAESPPQAWHAFGLPCTGVYFPLSFDADPPAAFRGGELWRRAQRLLAYAASGARQRDEVREALYGLQARFDVAAAEFHAEEATLRPRGDWRERQRLTEAFLQRNLERWEEVYASFFEQTPPPRAGVREEAPMFVG
jgi:secernin